MEGDPTANASASRFVKVQRCAEIVIVAKSALSVLSSSVSSLPWRLWRKREIRDQEDRMGMRFVVVGWAALLLLLRRSRLKMALVSMLQAECEGNDGAMKLCTQARGEGISQNGELAKRRGGRLGPNEKRSSPHLVCPATKLLLYPSARVRGE